jgi:3-deoxy-7-phosphoheptulonate synthase
MHNLKEHLTAKAEHTLINPEKLIAELPITETCLQTVIDARHVIEQIMHQADQRLLVIVGPCSIHNTQSALEYAELLSKAAKQFADKLFIVMRVYFEKPRTTIGWKGLISDPFLDGTFDINTGLRQARKLLLDINHLGLPAATEFLDSIIPHYLSDLISWCAIGARTSESQLHRELASGLPMPVGFKNSTDGNIQIAVDAIQVANQSHPFLTINMQGNAVLTRTPGNPNCHIVLRGSHSGPNFSEQHITEASLLLKNAKLNQSIVIDCSHGNSMKTHSLQVNVVENIIKQFTSDRKEIRGIMLESNLLAGKQNLHDKPLVYGQSITDACMGWNETLKCLELLANAHEKSTMSFS